MSIFKDKLLFLRDAITVFMFGLAVISVIGILAFGGWHLKRWFNYEFGYKDQIQTEIEPLRKEIEELKKRIEILEYKPEKILIEERK